MDKIKICPRCKTREVTNPHLSYCTPCQNEYCRERKHGKERQFLSHNPQSPTKTCPVCGQTKSRTEFYKNKSNQDGIGSICKECAKDSKKRAYWRDPEQGRNKSRGNYQKYKPAIREAKKAWVQRRRDQTGEAIFSRYDWSVVKQVYGRKCVYCGNSTRTLFMEHYVPVIAGGKTSRKNIVPACQSCNSSKRSRMPYEWVDPLVMYAIETIQGGI